jgi:hypothetical protein
VDGEAMVVLTRKHDGLTFHKDMGESVNPYYYDAPKKLLDKLDASFPPCNDYAKQWRAKCRERFNRPKLKYGDLVKFSKELRFDNIDLTEDTFEFHQYTGKRNIFKSSSTGKLVRIPDYAKREFTVLSN